MRNALYTLAVALCLTVIFHFFLAGYFHAWPLSLFGLGMIGGVVFLRSQVKLPMNTWAFVLLIPAACGIIAASLYSSEVVEVFAPLAIGLSMAFFTFWISMKRQSFAHVPRLWSFEILRDTAFPFPSLLSFVRHFGRIPYGLRIVTGILLALPFLLIFASLFASADPLFRRVVEDIVGDLLQESGILKLIRDAFVALYFVAAGWIMFGRAERQEVLPEASPVKPVSQAVIASFLGMINFLFVIFIGFQAAFFFGGESIIRSYDLTYAEYARGGFFQLLVVAGLVLTIAWVIYALTLRESKVARWMAVVLIGQTMVVLVSAVLRLSLYIDAYGMTVARWWAYAGLGVVGVMLVAVCICLLSRWPYYQGAKGLFLLALCLPSILLLCNVEAMVAKQQIQRMSEGKYVPGDLRYLVWNLHSDAVPTLIEGLSKLPEKEREELRRLLKAQQNSNDSEWKGRAVSTKDWRDLRLMDVLTSVALPQLDKP